MLVADLAGEGLALTVYGSTRASADNGALLPRGSPAWPWGKAPDKAWFEELDVPYGHEHDRQKADIYWPANTQPPGNGWSAVIILHGIGTSKESFKGFCTKYIVPTGRLCMSGDYDRNDDLRNADVYALMNWFYGAAQGYNVSRKDIVLGGFSLGGLSINNVIWDPRMGKDLLQGDSPKVRAVMLLSGTWGNHILRVRSANYFPKSTFIMSSTTDETVPFEFSESLAEKLESMGKPVKFVAIQNAGHNIMYSTKADQWYREIQSFLDDTVPGGQ